GRTKAYIAVTHVSVADASLHDQVSYIAGYELKANSTVKLIIGKETFSLDLLQKDRAWAKDADADKALVGALRRGNTLVIRGTSPRGGEAANNRAGGGSPRAYQAIGAPCRERWGGGGPGGPRRHMPSFSPPPPAPPMGG